MDERAAYEQPFVDFFLAMQRLAEARDYQAIAAMHAPLLLDISPAGARLIENDAALVEELAERGDWLARAGARSIKALEINPTPVGAGCAMVQVRWSIWFTPHGEPGIVDEFLADYLVQATKRGLEVLAFIQHDDDIEFQRRMAAIVGA